MACPSFIVGCFRSRVRRSAVSSASDQPLHQPPPRQQQHHETQPRSQLYRLQLLKFTHQRIASLSSAHHSAPPSRVRDAPPCWTAAQEQRPDYVRRPHITPTYVHWHNSLQSTRWTPCGFLPRRFRLRQRTKLRPNDDGKASRSSEATRMVVTVTLPSFATEVTRIADERSRYRHPCQQ